MTRKPNTDRQGRSFDSESLRHVWDKGEQVPGSDPDRVRRDVCGNRIEWSEYGNESDRAWHVDHRLPVAAGGGDELANLQPLQWRENLEKGDTYPWNCGS